MVKLEFLGINGSIQGPDSGNTSLLITGRDCSVMVDVSTDIYKAVDADIDALIITHEHIDHVYGLPSLIHQLWLLGRRKPLDIFCDEKNRDFVDSILDLYKLRQKKGIFEITTRTDSEFGIGELRFETFRTDHTECSIGIVVTDGERRLVYVSDTAPLADPPKKLLKADMLIHETNSTASSKKGLHSCGSDAAKLALDTGAKNLMLCHLPREAELKEAILQEARLVFDKTYIPEVGRSYIL